MCVCVRERERENRRVCAMCVFACAKVCAQESAFVCVSLCLHSRLPHVMQQVCLREREGEEESVSLSLSLSLCLSLSLSISLTLSMAIVMCCVCGCGYACVHAGPHIYI